MVKMKESGIEWIGEIPEDWEISKVKYELLNLDEKRKPISAEKRNQNADILYDYYGASGVIDKIDGYTIDDHVMLIGEDGANLVLRNLPLMYEVNGKAWINNHAHILKPQNKNVFKYLFFTLESTDLFPYITGSAQPKLNQENLNNIFIPIPNIKKQKRIADFLDVKCSKINSLNRDIEKQIEILEQYKKSVITEAVTKGINSDVKMKDSEIEWIREIPEHWETKALGYILKERIEKNSPIKTDVILSLSIDIGITLYSEKTTNLDRYKDDISGYKLAHKGDLVLNSMNVISGAEGISNYYGCVSPVYYVLYDNDEENHYIARYYDYYFKTMTLRKYLFSIGKGILAIDRGEGRVNTCRLKVSNYDLKHLHFPLPPKNEIDSIVRYLDKKCMAIDNAISTKKEQLEKLEEYKKSLIFEYVTGKREV